MNSKYEKHFVSNAFIALNSRESLEVLGLSLAANDLMSNLEAMKNIPEQENTYFFYSSIAIAREVAKLVKSIEKSTLSKKFSKNTCSYFGELSVNLAPFHDGSFTKSILKPIRDVISHYDLTRSAHAEWDEVVGELRRLNQIEVGLISNNSSLGAQRYTFADTIRTKYMNQFLNKNIVSQLSSTSASICAFIDSLLNDLISPKQT